MVGGYLYFPEILKADSLVHFLGWIDPQTAAKIGKQLLYGGISLAVLINVIHKKWAGFIEIMSAIAIFGDALSYLRLYALALAGAIVASTFNLFGTSLGLIIGGLVIIIGHFVNINLCIMGGVIHGLRLNFIEWYHYCFEGGGRLFNPLRRLKIKE
jgi:V/A-type H+-transporting ATPase subunit I